jgi:hypothetical protein
LDLARSLELIRSRPEEVIFFSRVSKTPPNFSASQKEVWSRDLKFKFSRWLVYDAEANH